MYTVLVSDSSTDNTSPPYVVSPLFQLYELLSSPSIVLAM